MLLETGTFHGSIIYAKSRNPSFRGYAFRAEAAKALAEANGKSRNPSFRGYAFRDRKSDETSDFIDAVAILPFADMLLEETKPITIPSLIIVAILPFADMLLEENYIDLYREVDIRRNPSFRGYAFRGLKACRDAAMKIRRNPSFRGYAFRG